MQFRGFIGTHPIVLDAKQRLTVPASFREQLRIHSGAESFWLIPHWNGSLLALRPEQYQRLIEHLAASVSVFAPDDGGVLHSVAADSMFHTCDSAGRIVLGDAFRKHARFEKGGPGKGFAVGMGPTFSFWSEELYAPYLAEQATVDARKKAFERLAQLGIQVGL